mmetsp:Transcript_44708/g.71763  ORF Transcript_44708/g.71763 Transcript_44708/m.71763 type:complete len:251 (-) Transcript_44708:1232-1984(-)
MTATPPWSRGVEIALNATGTGPFFGQMGVAPAPSRGVLSSILPGAHGGNLDNKRLGPGATLYLPVNVDGALFSAGDGHAVQGDGEFCVTALETSMHGRFRLTVLTPGSAGSTAVFHDISGPRAETATHYITMAFHEDLNEAQEAALLDMLAWMHRLTGVSRIDLYRTASLVGDMAVTQVVNGRKGVHLMMPKSIMDAMAAAANDSGGWKSAARAVLAAAEAIYLDVQHKVADFLLICKGKCAELLAKYEL